MRLPGPRQRVVVAGMQQGADELCECAQTPLCPLPSTHEMPMSAMVCGAEHVAARTRMRVCRLPHDATATRVALRPLLSGTRLFACTATTITHHYHHLPACGPASPGPGCLPPPRRLRVPCSIHGQAMLPRKAPRLRHARCPRIRPTRYALWNRRAHFANSTRGRAAGPGTWM